MAQLHEIGFETPEDYKDNALERGKGLLDDVLDSARYLNTIRQAGLFDDFAAAVKVGNADIASLYEKMKASNVNVDDTTFYDLLVEKYPDADFLPGKLDVLREKIKDQKIKEFALLTNGNPNIEFSDEKFEELRQEARNNGFAEDSELAKIEKELNLNEVELQKREEELAKVEPQIKVDYSLDRFDDALHTSQNPHLNGLDALAERAQSDPKLQEKIQLLTGFYEQAFNGANGSEPLGYEINKPHIGANRASFSYEPTNESLSLKVMDLNGTGLNFALNINKATDKPQSLVLTNDNSEMSEAQIKELARFFYKGGLIKNPDLINLPSDIKVLGDSGKSFKDIFNEAFMAEQNTQAHEEEKEKQELPPQNDGQPMEGASNDRPAVQGDEYDKYLNSKELSPSYSKMRGAMEARAGIMGFRKNLLHWRRNLDGSMTLVAYLNEADERNDAELDKKGLQSRKKAFAVKVHKGPPPKSWLYIEPGKEIKSGHAKLILKAFQSQGCEYFTAGPTVELGGSGNSAFWKAAGSIPICPKLKRSKNDDGFDGFANDNLQEMLKIHKEEAKINPKESLIWKMRLARELEGYTKFKRESGKPDGKLETSLEMLKGDIKFSRFTASYQSTIESYIREQCRPEKEDRWTTADMASAVMASEELLYAIANGKDKNGKPFNYDYINQDPQKLIDFMVVKMAENRPTVDKLIDAQYEKDKRAPRDPEDEETQGSALERAANKILKNAKDNLNAFVEGDLVSNYGEAAKIKINFPSAEPPTAETRYRNTPHHALDDNGNADHSPNNQRNQLYKKNRPPRIPIPERGPRGA